MDSEFFTHTKDGAATSMIGGADFTDISLLHTSKNGFTEVYKAKRYGKWHVLKCLTKDARDTQHFQQLLQKEFEISYQLNHQGVVQTIGMESLSPALPHREGDRNHPVLAIVQEYIDGETWNEFFAKAENRKAPPPSTGRAGESLAIRVLCELCDAIDFIHQHQIIHRDIKPENILITRDGHHPKLIDFGLADRDVYADLKEPAGTKGYASPEQQKEGILDNRSDIYALGVLINSLSSELGNGKLSRIARRCMAIDASQRYQNAREVKEALQKSIPLGRFAIMVAFAVIIVAFLAIYYSQSSEIDELHRQTSSQLTEISSLDSMVKQQDKTLKEQSSKNQELDAQLVAQHRHDSIIAVIIEEVKKDEQHYYKTMLKKYPVHGLDIQDIRNAGEICRQYGLYKNMQLSDHCQKIILRHGIKTTDTDYPVILNNALSAWEESSKPHLNHLAKDVVSEGVKQDLSNK